ncbi:MAG: hypothetical protein K8L91_08455 [Anaerolineae bacterium]|nr:hypothetical protein [Anaerolineae bacterium]
MTKKYLYRDYIVTLSNRFTGKLSEIATTHNFDYGDEFEVAICEVIQSVLPTQYGVVRGYAVDKNGETAGDDIIIYERVRFPSLKPRDKQDFARKEYIPIEAIYCYIEAKHTIHLAGADAQSLEHAIDQVSKVKDLIARRKPVGLAFISPALDLSQVLILSRSENIPNIKNPFFSMILARNVKIQKHGVIIQNPAVINEKLQSLSQQGKMRSVDMMVLGSHNVVSPFTPLDTEGNRLWASPFFMPEKSQYGCIETPQISFGIALATIMSAIDVIQLGAMPWAEILADAYGFNYQDKPSTLDENKV